MTNSKAPAKEVEGTLSISIQDSKNAGLAQNRKLSDEEQRHYSGLIEAILFVATEPITLGMLAKHCGLGRVNVRSLVDMLMDEYETRDGGIVLREIAGGYRFITSERYSKIMKNTFESKKREKLSRGVLETLSIICYQQPITLAEVEDVRGVHSRSMIATLLQRKLIKPQGQRPVAGRPTLYATTHDFLVYFSLNSLNDLPSLKELKEFEFEDVD